MVIFIFAPSICTEFPHLPSTLTLLEYGTQITAETGLYIQTGFVGFGFPFS